MNYKKLTTTILALFLIISVCPNGEVPDCAHHKHDGDPVIAMPTPAEFFEEEMVDSLSIAESDSIMAPKVEDIPMKVARILGKDLLLSTDGYPLDQDDIYYQINKESDRRNDSNYVHTYCKEYMAYFNLVDDWAQIICFKRKDDSFLVFLIQYYDWKDGYGIIKNKYYILNGDVLTPTQNPLKKFDYIANNDDTIGIRYDFVNKNSKYDPTRLKLNTAPQALKSGLVSNTINAELMWTGRDFIELASDHSMPNRDDIMRFWKAAMPENADIPGQYARTDIDSDGNDEYIFTTSDRSQNRFAIFTYINNELAFVAGNYDTDREVTMHLGGFVKIQDPNSGTIRHIRLMGSEVCGIYNFNENTQEYTFSADRSINTDPIDKSDYTSAIRRMRKEVKFNDLDWRFWNAGLAK